MPFKTWVWSAVFFFSACSFKKPSVPDLLNLPGFANAQPLFKGDSRAMKAVTFFKKGQFFDASVQINLSLQAFPNQPMLHVLNGITYMVLAQTVDPSKMDLATAAFDQALLLDPSCWHAAYGLGMALSKSGRFGAAEQSFLRALLIKPAHFETLQNVAYTAYYAQDFYVAEAAIRRALELQPNNLDANRSAAVIFSAVGHQEEAQKSLEFLQQDAFKMLSGQLDLIKRRMAQWNSVHERWKNGMGPVALVMDEDLPEITKELIDENQEVLFECYVVRIDEHTHSSHGQNIFDMLTAHGHAITGKAPSNSADPAQTGQKTQAGSWSAGIKGMEYKLNMFQSTNSSVELLAHPTLSASVGVPAVLHSGQNVYSGVQNPKTGTTQPALISSGVSLEIKPLEVTSKGVVFEVFFKGALGPDFDKKRGVQHQIISMTSSEVKTTFTLKFNEMGAVGGLYEHTNHSSQTGVPKLNKIPFLKNLFGNETSGQRRSSVAFFVKPMYPDRIQKSLAQTFWAAEARKERGLLVHELCERGDLHLENQTELTPFGHELLDPAFGYVQSRDAFPSNTADRPNAAEVCQFVLETCACL